MLIHVEDYCRWGISCQGLAGKLGYKTASGALKLLHRISDRIKAGTVFNEFKPPSADILHADEIVSKEHGRSVYRIFVRGGGENRIAYGWGFSQARNLWIITTLLTTAFRHNRKIPKVFVSDGLTEYHTSFVSICAKEHSKVRTIFLGRKRDSDIQWLNSQNKARAYSISKSGYELIIHKGI